jgi:hypothetical protein
MPRTAARPPARTRRTTACTRLRPPGRSRASRRRRRADRPTAWPPATRKCPRVRILVDRGKLARVNGRTARGDPSSPGSDELGGPPAPVSTSPSPELRSAGPPRPAPDSPRSWLLGDRRAHVARRAGLLPQLINPTPATSARDSPPTTDESLRSGDDTSPALRPRSGCSSHGPKEKRHMSAAACAHALHARRDEGRDPFNHHPRQNRAIR